MISRETTNMEKKLKDYQIRAIEGDKRLRKKGLYDLFEFFLDEGKTIVFKAPTGSGKTFIMTKLIEKISNDITDRKICYIWASIGKGDLYRQSYDNIKSELKGVPVCSLLTPSYLSSHSAIPDKEIIFVNWEKIVKWDKSEGWKNSMMKEREGRSFINLIDKTKENGTLIVLIIDESHIGKTDDAHIQKIQEEVINPHITIEVSATPKAKADVIIDEDEVAEEGMIKQKLIINKDIWVDHEGYDSESLVMEKAYKKRAELKKAFEVIGSKVNPLCLIQVPNSEAGDEMISFVEDFLRKKDVTLSNGKLVMWMTDSPSFDKKAITKINNSIEFMIFKTVVDTGWDCPRAQILVKFRDVKSNISLKQTIGRILRTPEAKKYDIPLLDNGYLFTNMEYIEPIDDVYNPNRVNDITVKIKRDENGIRIDDGFQLESFYKSRAGAYNSADSRIYEIIEDEFCKYFSIKKDDVIVDETLRSKGLKISDLSKTSIINEIEVMARDYAKGQKLGGDTSNIDIESSANQIKAQYDLLIAKNLNGLARVRSISPVKTGLANTIENHISGITRNNKFSYTQLLAVRNQDIIGTIINRSTFEFKKRFPDAQQVGDYSDFIIEEERNYASATYEEIISELSLYEKMYVIKQGTSQLEKDFVSFLDRNKHAIKWVWHNGSEPNIDNFGVAYKSDTETFRPDFIIHFTNDKVGIFDTKGVDLNVEDTKAKAEGLIEYIESRKAEKNLIGGIVIYHNGTWYYNTKKDYKTILEAPGDWIPFSTLLG
jgi:type III restriction enzyme